jgi:hypothetical protein
MAGYDLTQQLTKNIDKANIQNLVKFTDMVKSISQSNCPVDTGHLKNSWWVRTDKMTENKVRISFGYGANYAMPADYYTGGVEQEGFFSGAINEAMKAVFDIDTKVYTTKQSTMAAADRRRQWKQSPFAGQRL